MERNIKNHQNRLKHHWNSSSFRFALHFTCFLSYIPSIHQFIICLDRSSLFSGCFLFFPRIPIIVYWWFDFSAMIAFNMLSNCHAFHSMYTYLIQLTGKYLWIVKFYLDVCVCLYELHNDRELIKWWCIRQDETRTPLINYVWRERERERGRVKRHSTIENTQQGEWN